MFPPASPPHSPSQPDRNVLDHAAALMPWAISITFHVGLLLVLMFFTFLIVQTPEDDRLVSAAIASMAKPDTGMQVRRPDRPREDKAESKSRRELETPALELTDKQRKAVDLNPP